MRILIKEATAFDIAADVASRTSFKRKLTGEEQKAKQRLEKEAQIEERSKKIIDFVKKEKESGFVQRAIKKWNQLWHNHTSSYNITKFGTISDFEPFVKVKGSKYEYKKEANYILVSKFFDIDNNTTFTITYYFPDFEELARPGTTNLIDQYEFELANKFNIYFEPTKVIAIKEVAYSLDITPPDAESDVNEQVKSLLKLYKGKLLLNPPNPPKPKRLVRRVVSTSTPASSAATVTESIFNRWKLLALIK
jgi:hypothetical protein